jgi:hypothetical protein
MTDNTNIISGTVLITALTSTLYLTEINNKKKDDNYNLSLDIINKNVKLTNTTIYYPEISLTDCIIDGYKIRQEDIINRNLYIKSTNNTNNTKSSSFIITPSLNNLNEPIILKKVNIRDRSDFHINNMNLNLKPTSNTNIIIPPNVEVMSIENYIYLASFNKTYTEIYEYNNISYTIEVYSIPLNTQIMKVEGLNKYQNELKIPIYEYEFGPEKYAIINIKNRKIKINIYRKWIIRVILIIILLLGLSFIIVIPT